MKKYINLAILMVASSTLGHATNLTLGLAQGYNVFTFSNFSPTGADTLGKVAVGGNFYSTGYQVGSNLSDSASTLDFIVKGNLTDSNFTTTFGVYAGGNATLNGASVGNLYVGGTLNVGNITTAAITAKGNITATGSISNSGNIYTPGSFSVSGNANGTIYAGSVSAPSYVVSRSAAYNAATALAVPTNPIDFATAQTSLTSLSSQLQSTAANGTVTVDQYNKGITLSSSNTTLTQQVFNVTAAQLSAALANGAGGITVNANKNAVVIINVTGTDVVNISGSSVSINNTAVSNVLFNFPQTTTINYSVVGFYGSILAPGATFAGSGGNVDGSVIVNAITGTTEFHNYDLFNSTISVNSVTATPEPSTWMMSLTAIFFCGYLARKKFNARRN